MAEYSPAEMTARLYAETGSPTGWLGPPRTPPRDQLAPPARAVNRPALEVCRDFIRGKCTREERECRFAHSQPSGGDTSLVTVCQDFLKGKCERDICRYFHPPDHLKPRIRDVPPGGSMSGAGAPAGSLSPGRRVESSPPPSFLSDRERIVEAAAYQAAYNAYTASLNEQQAAAKRMRLEEERVTGGLLGLDFGAEDLRKTPSWDSGFQSMEAQGPPPLSRSSSSSPAGGTYTMMTMRGERHMSPPHYSERTRFSPPPPSRFSPPPQASGGLGDRLRFSPPPSSPTSMRFSPSPAPSVGLRFSPPPGVRFSPPPISQGLRFSPPPADSERMMACRDYLRGKCVRTPCRFVHPPSHVLVSENQVTVCRDALHNRCMRELCRFYHPTERPHSVSLYGGY
eukprot:TRINITY_DN8931_c0_g3_i1.p1 TRINITY_DN8931_c0_g3~~TRINITY_DN8931_c0_g3_i1.p1  ORF type:complete len:397 (+),score=51.71 TRINITY_DN8931_c0_g3_i1:488-1678(+)